MESVHYHFYHQAQWRLTVFYYKPSTWKQKHLFLRIISVYILTIWPSDLIMRKYRERCKKIHFFTLCIKKYFILLLFFKLVRVKKENEISILCRDPFFLVLMSFLTSIYFLYHFPVGLPSRISCCLILLSLYKFITYMCILLMPLYIYF